MALIKLYDGTTNQNNGIILKRALAELARFQRVHITPTPGLIDISGYNLVQRLAAESTHQGRRQVHVGELLNKFKSIPAVVNEPERQNIILLEQDLYSDGLNWCFGGYQQHAGVDFVTVSTARIQDDIHLFHILAHELGHMYGATYQGRSNTEQNLGSHCTNDLCVMQQQLTVADSVRYAHRRMNSNAPTYCRQCGDNLKTSLHY